MNQPAEFADGHKVRVWFPQGWKKGKICGRVGVHWIVEFKKPFSDEYPYRAVWCDSMNVYDREAK